MQVLKTLANVTDKLGIPVVIKSSNGINYTPALTFYLKNYAELINNGIGHPVFNIYNNTPVIWAEIDEVVVGCIIYVIKDDSIQTAWIWLSAVDSNYRQRGLYTLMHTQFEKVAKAGGSKKISSHVHVNNLARQQSCTSVGMLPVWLKMEKDL